MVMTVALFCGRFSSLAYATGSVLRFLGELEEFFGLGQGGGGEVFAGGHFGEFGDAGFAFHQGDGGGGFSPPTGGGFGFGGDGFADGEVAVGEGGDLREVGDAQDLVDGGQVAEFFADDGAHASADVGVDFVEDQDVDAVGPPPAAAFGEDGFEGQHDAGEFSAGGDAAEGAGGLAGVGSDEEFGGFQAARSREIVEGEGGGVVGDKVTGWQADEGIRGLGGLFGFGGFGGVGEIRLQRLEFDGEFGFFHA